MSNNAKVTMEFLTTDKDCTLVSNELSKQDILAFAQRKGIDIVNLKGKKIEEPIDLNLVHYIKYNN